MRCSQPTHIGAQITWPILCTSAAIMIWKPASSSPTIPFQSINQSITEP